MVNSELYLLPSTSKLTDSRDGPHVEDLVIVVLVVVLLYDALRTVSFVLSIYGAWKIHDHCQLHTNSFWRLPVALSVPVHRVLSQYGGGFL